MRELNGAGPNRTRAALHQHGAPLNRTRHVNSPMRGYAGNAETGALLERDNFGQRDHPLQRNYRVFGRRAERAVSLRRITPHAPSNPFLGYTLAHGINHPSAIAVGNDTRIRHPVSVRILTLLHIARIDARGGNMNPHLTRERLWLIHLTDG
jgi:hypothetical protein